MAPQVGTTIFRSRRAWRATRSGVQAPRSWTSASPLSRTRPNSQGERLLELSPAGADQGIQRRFRGDLFGSPAAAAAAFEARRRWCAQHTGNFESARMFLAVGGQQFVVRQRVALRLQPFLQASLGILWRGPVRIRAISENPAQQRAAGIKTAIQINRGDQRLECIGQNRIAPETAALQFAGAEQQIITQPDRARALRERRAADQLRAQARQLALVG